MRVMHLSRSGTNRRDESCRIDRIAAGVGNGRAYLFPHPLEAAVASRPQNRVSHAISTLSAPVCRRRSGKFPFLCRISYETRPEHLFEAARFDLFRLWVLLLRAYLRDPRSAACSDRIAG